MKLTLLFFYILAMGEFIIVLFSIFAYTHPDWTLINTNLILGWVFMILAKLHEKRE